jgi:N-acetyl-anhydromuramyl-L-alanine amidase AmpD
MRYNSLPLLEKRFRDEAAAFLRPFSLPVPGEPTLTVNGMLYTPKQRNYFYSEQYPKERIVLHFTAGNTWSDMRSLTQDGRHVSVAFLIARDGTIYQLFPSNAWSGHLGKGVGNDTGNQQDKATIGIEISNYGYLVPRDGNLETVYSRVKDPATGVVSAPDPYCTLEQKEAYVKINQPFRDQSYYASFTLQQMESTAILLRYLTNKYNIPREFLPEEKRFLTTNDVLQFKGIVSHINYRISVGIN